MIFKQWQSDHIPRHQVDCVTYADPKSLFLNPEPTVVLSESLQKDYKTAIVVPLTLSWLLPQNRVPLLNISKLTATLKQTPRSNVVNSKSNINSQFYETEEERTLTDINLSYKIYEYNSDTLLVLIEEDDLRYPPILHNYLAADLAEVLKKSGSDIHIISNSDKIIGVKNLSDLKPPEFMSGAMASVTTTLLSLPNTLPDKNVLIAQSEGPNGFEKHNISVVDTLIGYMKELLGLSDDYTVSSYNSWKSNSSSQFQGGLYL